MTAIAPTPIAPGIDLVERRRGKTGPVPGQAILLHPQRDVINAWIFRDRIPLSRVSRMCLDKYHFVVSPKSLRGYYRRYKDTILSDIANASGVVVLDEVEKDARKTYGVLKKLIAQAERNVDEGRLILQGKEVVNLIKAHFDLLGGTEALKLVTAEERYGAGLEAVMEAIQDECDEATKQRIGYRLEGDERFLAAMAARENARDLDETVAAAVSAVADDEDDEDDD